MLGLVLFVLVIILNVLLNVLAHPFLIVVMFKYLDSLVLPRISKD